MALAWFTSTYSDIAKGVDSRSIPNQIQDGFSADLVNVDTNSEGHLSKRKGYQGYHGYVPFRVASVDYDDLTQEISFVLDGSVNLINTESSPIIVYGKLGNETMDGDFTSSLDQAQYYTTFEVDQPIEFLTGTNTYSATAAEANISTNAVFVGVTESLSVSNTDNALFFPDEIRVDAASYGVDIDYTNSTGSNIPVYIYYTEKPVTTGTVYHETVTAQSVVTIPASSHNLDNFNIIPQIEELVAGEYTYILPDSLTIDSAGEVVATFSQTIGSGRIILSAAPATNIATGALASGGSSSITISNPASPFAHVACYFEEIPGSGDLEWCMPDNVAYDSTLNELTISFTNNTGADANFEIYYEFGNINLNTIKVQGTVTTPGTDSEPQLTLWGISHEGAYNSNATGGGHVSHIDSYKRVAESRVICGLGGNIFRALNATELGSEMAPTYYVNLRGRIAANTKTAPLFQVSGTTLDRARGTIEATDVTSDNQAVIQSAQWVSGNSIAYTISLPSKAILDSAGVATTLSSVISTTSGLEDYLTVTQMNHSRLNGTFKITAIQDSVADVIVLTVENTNIDSADYNELNANGLSAVYTDQLVLLATTSFIADDTVVSDVIPTADTVTISSASGSTIVLNSITSEIAWPSGVRINGQRTSATFPLRLSGGTPGSSYLVQGDMLDVTGYIRSPRITAIDTVNHTITLDEALTLQDTGDNSVSLVVMGRWFPVEIPESDGDLTPTTKVFHFDKNGYAEQPVLRSTIITDNMYFANGDDEILKTDGSSIYRAGLLRWQPNLFSSIDTSTESFSVTDINVTGVSGYEFTVSGTEHPLYSVGTNVYHSDDGEYYTIQSVDSTGLILTVDKAITGTGAGTLNIYQEYRYYFRLNMIDRNDNIIGSAAAGSEDFRVRVPVNGQIKMKLVGMPIWDIYDYDRIELQVYRTTDREENPFFEINTIPVDFDKDGGYLLLTDGTPDFALGIGDLDPAMSALLGNNLGLNWSQPLRAKYVTSAANRLVLANLSDYPEYDITIRKIRTDDKLTKDDLSSAGEQKWLFRKDNTDTGTVTDMVNRALYQFRDVTGSSTIATPATDITSPSAGVLRITASQFFIAGQWVYLHHSAEGVDNDLTFAGWYQVTDSSSGVWFEVANPDARAGTADDVDQFAFAQNSRDIPVVLGVDGNYNHRDSNPEDTRPYGTTAMIRLANAINATMRMTNTDIAGFEDFEPWLVAAAGQEFGSGRLIIRQPKILTTNLELELDIAHGTSYQVFVNNTRRVADEVIGADTRLLPSRMQVSYENFPEIFDGPGLSGSSVIDVNPADGQAITGIIPFFAEAAFGNAQKEASVVVFKSQSIYIVDVVTQSVQKIDSQGLGCTAPFSIAPTRNGIMFANQSGIYRLNYDLTISYAGHMLEGTWKNTVNRDGLSTATGHHYALERRYQLSVPISTSTKNSDVLVYDHTREGKGQEFGAWTTYNNFPSCGWANLDNDAYFATTNGQVFSLRRAGNVSDYRDDGSAVAEMSILTKPFTFGVAGIRHKLRNIISHFEILASMTGTTLETAIDLSTNFISTDAISITDIDSDSLYLDREVVSVRSSIAVQKFVFVQLRYKNSTKDEAVVLAGLNFTAAPLNARGIQQPGTTGITS